MRYPKIALILIVAGTLIGGMAVLAGSDAPTYVGAGKCKPCHFKQYKSWAETKMAKAYDQLKSGAAADAKKKAGLDPNKDYSADPECLKCHTTGYGRPGGFTSVADTPKMVGVGCEMCHGPGSAYSGIMKTNKEYKKDEVIKAGLTSPPAEKQCIKCHNTESPFLGDNDEFDFEARKDQGTHEHFDLKYTH